MKEEVDLWRDKFNQSNGELIANKSALQHSNASLDVIKAERGKCRRETRALRYEYAVHEEMRTDLEAKKASFKTMVEDATISHREKISRQYQDEARKLQRELINANEQLAKLKEDKRENALAYADKADQVVELEQSNQRRANGISNLEESNKRLTKDSHEVWLDTVKMRRLLDGEATELNGCNRTVADLQQDITSLIADRQNDAIEIERLKDVIADKVSALERSKRDADLHKRRWNNSKATANRLKPTLTK